MKTSKATDRVLTILSKSTPAYVALADLPKLVKRHSPDDVWLAVEQLASEGDVDIWFAAPGGPSLILSPLGASRRGVRFQDASDVKIGTKSSWQAKRKETGPIPGPETYASR